MTNREDSSSAPGPPAADLPQEAGSAPASTLRLLAAWPGREEELAESLRLYIDYLLRQNRRFNLTGDRDPATQWAAHIDDALACGALLQHKIPAMGEGRQILDVGSGGGIPGLVWALLWPGAKVSLLEATGKKARFLDAAAGLLGLGNVHVLTGRAEELAHQRAHRERYDLVTARALAALPTLAEWTLPFVRPGGYLAAIKGPDVSGEIGAARSACARLGASPEPEVFPYTRSDGRACHLLVYGKREPTPQDYPRRGDLARRRPIQ